jgi:hypothetical protein
MGHFAKVLSGIVQQVIVAEPDFFQTFVDSSPGEWIQTSYNTRGNVHYAPNSNDTGSGGGSGSATSTYGANGGSGLVIVSYPDTYSAASATTGSPAIALVGGYRYYKFTSSGSMTF